MTDILVINGPNLNLLGKREPELYGSTTLVQLEDQLRAWGDNNGYNVRCAQSNAEHDIVGAIQDAAPFGPKPADGIVINAGAFTHTSVAILDALKAAGVPYVEVHISNVYAREAFRHKSFLSANALGVMAGVGTHGYTYALDLLTRTLTGQPNTGEKK